MKKKTQVFWEPWEIGRLHYLCDVRGLSAEKIHKLGLLPRHTQHGIAGKMNTEDLGDSEMKIRSRKAKKLAPKERAVIASYLAGEGRRWTNRDVARKFKINPKIVYEMRKKLGFPLTSKESFSSRYFHRRHKHVLSALREGLREYHRFFWETRHDHLVSKFFDQIRRREFGELRVCRNCKNVWFATKTFFYRVRVRKDSSIRWSLDCKECGLPHERRQRLYKQQRQVS